MGQQASLAKQIACEDSGSVITTNAPGGIGGRAAAEAIGKEPLGATGNDGSGLKCQLHVQQRRTVRGALPRTRQNTAGRISHPVSASTTCSSAALQRIAREYRSTADGAAGRQLRRF